jgi:hypothetical protein
MYSTNDILEAVLLILPRLEELLGTETGQQVNTQIQQLLHQIQAKEAVENQLLELLAQHEPTRQEMKKQLGRSEDSDRTTKGIGYAPLPGDSTYAPLLGDSEPLPKPQFKCPHCEYTWSRLKLGKPTPFCSVHKVLLKPVL